MSLSLQMPDDSPVGHDASMQLDDTTRDISAIVRAQDFSGALPGGGQDPQQYQYTGQDAVLGGQQYAEQDQVGQHQDEEGAGLGDAELDTRQLFLQQAHDEEDAEMGHLLPGQWGAQGLGIGFLVGPTSFLLGSS